MDKSRSNNSKSNSAISNNKIERKCLRNSRENAKIPRTTIKKRGVYVEKFSDSGIEHKTMEEVPKSSNKKLIESVLIILTKSSKATQWPDEKNIRKNIIKLKNNENIMQFIKKDDEAKERKHALFKPNSVNKIAAKSQLAVGKSPSAKAKSPADKMPITKPKVEKTAPTKCKVTNNKTTPAKSKTTFNKAAPAKTKTPEPTTAQTIKPKFVARRVKRFLLRKASPDNTLINDKIIIKETPKESDKDIESTMGDKLDNSDHDAKIYSLIKDFLETTINSNCSDPSDKSESNLHIDEEVAKKLMIKSEENSDHCFMGNLDGNDSSSTTIRQHIKNNTSKVIHETRETIEVSTEVAEGKVQRKDKNKSKKPGDSAKNIAKPIIISNKSTTEHPKQKAQRKSTPVPKFVNRSDYLVQHIYNIQLDSHTLKTKKFELVKQLKNPSVFQKPQNFFETLSLILKNKNSNEKPNTETKLTNMKKITKTKKNNK